ncbi:hypothetical protein GCK32_011055 [Trichostrongylus colubriformis]|uniref:Uncharacterized protein n=1 Tax=Trichostrongylus colubriformis TaxID=6319 RepID=A0AAN8IJ58_TRICO
MAVFDSAVLLIALSAAFARCSTPVEPFNLRYVKLEPPPKPPFLANATHETIKQFMAIFHLSGIPQMRKVNELDVMIGTLRPEVQLSYQRYKADALLLKLSQDERLQEITEKTHFTMVHLEALKNSKSTEIKERKRRLEAIFSKYSDFMIQAVTIEVADVVDNIMQNVLRALLFTERMTQK